MNKNIVSTSEMMYRQLVIDYILVRKGQILVGHTLHVLHVFLRPRREQFNLALVTCEMQWSHERLS